MSHLIVFTPGLSERASNASVLEDYGFAVHLSRFGWDQPRAILGERLRLYKQAMEEAIAGYDQVWLVGESAGGSAVLNVWHELGCPKEVKPMMICSRLREGSGVHAWLSWRIYSKRNPLFISSVIRCQNILSRMAPFVASEITSYFGIWDETVPIETSYVPGGKNIQVKSVGHAWSIRQALGQFGSSIR